MLFGRGFLLSMLGECVDHFADNAQHIETAIDQLRNTIKTNQNNADDRYQQLAELYDHYKQLISLPASAQASDLGTLKMNIALLEQRLSLPKSEALPSFMVNNAQDTKASAVIIA